MEHTDNLNIVDFKPLVTPEELKREFVLDDFDVRTVIKSRKVIQDIFDGKDSRRIVIVGPCSLYDKPSSFDYAQRLKKLQQQTADKLILVMRAYFEKPRTTLGWKGMLYDPYLNDSGDIEHGLKMARKILLETTKLGLPLATEILDPIVPQYLTDMISWAAIGARTTESQIHRQMASGLSMPIGFKNATDGNLAVAVDAVKSARSGHSFMGIDRNGKVIIAETKGNKYGHLVMRGGADCPNYSSEYVAFAEVLLQKAGVDIGIIVDCSHANSHKNYKLQRVAFLDVVEQIKNGNKFIAGVMLESFIDEGSQPICEPKNLKYGVSLTDQCIGWEETEELITKLAEVL